MTSFSNCTEELSFASFFYTQSIHSLRIRLTSYPCNKYEQIMPSYLLSVNYVVISVMTGNPPKGGSLTCSGHVKPISIYNVLQKYAHIGLNQNLFRSTTLDIIARFLTMLPLFVFMWWEDSQKILGSAWVEKSRVSALGWMDDNRTMRGIMKRSVSKRTWLM